MALEATAAFVRDVIQTLQSGTDKSAGKKLQPHTDVPGLEPVRNAIESTLSADADEAPLLFLDVVEHAAQLRCRGASLPNLDGEVQTVPEGGYWSSAMAGEVVYSLVPETRPFAKRAKPPQQIELLEAAARKGQVADLRLLPHYLKKLAGKTEDPVADTIAKTALPAFGPTILPDLWPTLSAENRTFLAAYRIDIEATLTRLLEKSGKKSTDKSGQVMKAVEMLLEDVLEEGAEVSAQSFPMLRLGLKYAPDANFRRKIAETIVSIGPEAVECLPDLIDAFERGGISRDHHLIRLLAVLGKESEEVGDALVRALKDHDSTVRLIAAFNLGQMGEPGISALPALETAAEFDADVKVREQAARTIAKLKLRLQPPVPESVLA